MKEGMKGEMEMTVSEKNKGKEKGKRRKEPSWDSEEKKGEKLV